MRKVLFLVVFSSFLILPSTAMAWGPATHTWITNELLENPDNNEILEMCSANQDNWDAFMAGSMVPDITVVYYFEHGATQYRATHNWNFQQEVMNQANNDREKAFAYGIAQHLVSDSVAHQKVIPVSIESHSLPNWLLHPLLEQKYDSHLVQKYPYLDDARKHMFDAIIIGPYGDRYIEMVENAVGAQVNFNVRDNIEKLAVSFDSYYDPENGAKKPTGAGIFGLYPIIYSACNIISPLTSISNVALMDASAERTLDENKNVFNNWGARHMLTAHGFDELAAAEEAGNSGAFTIAFSFYIILIFTVPIGVLVFVKRPLFAITTLVAMLLGLLAWIVWVYLTL